MTSQLKKLIEFHKTFGAYYSNNITRNIPSEVKKLRVTLMKDELDEVIKAMDNEPIENIAKELADLLYVTYGTIIAYGLQNLMDDIFSEVHKSNMSKVGNDGKPIYREDGKVLKGPNYKEPNIKKLL